MFRRLKSSNPIPFPRELALILCLGAVTAGCSSPDATKLRFVRSGDAYAAQGRYEEAIVEYRNAVQTDGRFTEARLKLARAYEHTGNDANALREFVRAADLQPGDDEAQITAARHFLTARRFDDARVRAERVVARSPKNIAARVLLGHSLAGLKDLESVVRDMETAFVQGFPLALEHAVTNTRARRTDDRSDEAERMFRQAVEDDPRSISARLGLANFCLAAGRGTEAERVLTEALAIAPGDVLTNRALALFYLASDRWPKAEAPLRTIAATGPQYGLFLADYYVRAHREHEARRVLAPLAEADGTFVEATVRLAEIDARAGDAKAASLKIGRALKRDAGNTRALTLRGQMQLTAGRPLQAIGDLQSAAAGVPPSLIARILLARAYEQTGAEESAMNAYEKVLKIDAASGVAHRQLARLQLRAGRIGAALEHAERAVSGLPSDLAARLLLARALVANREFVRALLELKAIVDDNPKSADAHAALGSILMAGRRWADARRSFNTALAIDASHADAAMGLINVAVETRNVAEARERLEAWKQRPSRDASLDVVAATAYVRIGADRLAENLVLKTIEAEPSLLAAYVFLGRLYLSQHRPEEARRQFEVVLERSPGSVGAATMLGVIFEAQHNVDAAQATYKHALELDPDAAVAANNLAWIYANGHGNLDVALQLAQTATRKLPEAPEVSDTLGWIYYRKNMADEAVAAFEQSVARKPESAEFQYHLGLAYLMAGKQRPGRDALARARQLDPEFARANEGRVMRPAP